jgi:eukaryotic-like serine/threonine-protein kinase
MEPGYLLRNRYCIQQPLASGCFCVTYLAIDYEYYRQKYVVVKQLKPQNKNPALLQIARRLFETEAMALKRLGDITDRIPTLYAYFEDHSEFYLVQEFIEGQTLAQELDRGKLSTTATIQILREILIGLSFVHAENTIHRDLKPDNIIRRSSDNALVLIDFGAVKEVRQTTLTTPNAKTLASIGFGTEGYMPSEQAMGYPKLASDIYAVGAIGIECLTGREPHELFDEELLEFKWQHLYRVSNLKHDPLISPLVMVLNKMLQQRHLDRYANAPAALAAIESILLGRIANENQSDLQLLPPQKLGSIFDKVSMNRSTFLKLIGLGSIGAIGSFLLAILLSRIAKIIQPSESALDPNQRINSGDILTIDRLETLPVTSIKLNDYGDVIDRPQARTHVFQEELGNGVFLTMVQIAAGAFNMGSPVSEEGREAYEQPQHLVHLPAFYLGQTLVTQAQWAEIFPDKSVGSSGDSQLPVSGISWLDAIEFCQRLSTKTGRKYRLPSESEWEYACRANTTSPFTYGDTILPSIVNHNGSYPYKLAPKATCRGKATSVAIFPPNLFGLYDMHGNLWEWCLDEWFPNYLDAPSDGSARGNIDARDGNQLRVVRGGSWFSYGRTCRAAYRASLSASFRHEHYGLRVVCTE